MTLSEIYFNYSKAIRQAEQLESISRNLDRKANSDLSGILSEVRSAWKSDNSNQYISKGTKVQTDIRTTAKNLRAIAASIRKIALQIRNAELEAWRIANVRK